MGIPEDVLRELEAFRAQIEAQGEAAQTPEERDQIIDMARANAIVSAASRRAGEVQLEQEQRDNAFMNLVGAFGKTAVGQQDDADVARIKNFSTSVYREAVIDPVKALAQIPGLFSSNELPTDRAVDFLVRHEQGLINRAEQAVLEAGLTPDEVALGEAAGKFLGFTAPLAGAFGMSKLLLKSSGSLTRWPIAGNFATDTMAGLIYGGALTPEEDLRARLGTMSREAAVFGAGRIILDGMLMGFAGVRFRKNFLNDRRATLDEMIKAMQKGDVKISGTIDDVEDFSSLLSEENMIMTSPAAMDLIKGHADEKVLFQAAADANVAEGQFGMVKNIGRDIGEAAQATRKLKSVFPDYKVAHIEQANGQYSVIFGPQKLSTKHLNHFKKHGRVPGQIIEKNGVRYVYEGRGKKSNMIQATRLGDKNKKVQLKDDNITEWSSISGPVSASQANQNLYERFVADMQTVNAEVEALGLDLLPEYELIRMIRNGELQTTSLSRRHFDVGGAITYPEELGAVLQATDDDRILRSILEQGYEAGGILPSRRIMSFEEMVELWAKKNGITPDSQDFQTLKHYFGARARQEFWLHAPPEELRIINNLRDEFLRLSENTDIPFETLAGTKGFTVARPGTGEVVLRDMNSGLTLAYESEEIARSAISKFIRHEKSTFGMGIFSEVDLGISGGTTGFRKVDDVFTFDDTAVVNYAEKTPMSTFYRNRRDVLIDIEEETGIPFFSEIVDKLNQGMGAMRQAFEPFSYKIRDIWKGFSIKEKNQVVKFWLSLQNQQLPRKEVLKLARNAGLTSKQISAFEESRKLFDVGHRLSDLPDEQYIFYYYSKIRPAADQLDGVLPEGIEQTLPPGFDWWAKKSRTGDLANVELDPEIVMHKYFRSLMWDKYVQPHYQPARNLLKTNTAPRIRDLPPEVQRTIRARNPELKPDSEVISPGVKAFLNEYLTILRGIPMDHEGTARAFLSRFMGKVGIDIHPEVLEEFVNVGVSTMYGAAMGGRPSLLSRNAMQNMWNMYTRVGPRHAGQAYERAMTFDGYKEVATEGAIRATTAGVPADDVLFRRLMRENPIEGRGPISRALASTMRFALRMGKGGTELTRKLLIPYTGVDDMNRAVAYFWQKGHTAEWLTKFEDSAISWEKFLDEGLPFFHPIIKQDFQRYYNKFGREKALRFIGRQASDETNFIYGLAAQPTFFQKPIGRFLGMFGTWPMWALEQYSRRVGRGTREQQARFIMRSAALVGAMGNLTYQTGINMWSWVAPFSPFSWTGGPAAEWGVDLFNVGKAPWDQKANALKNLGRDLSRLTYPGQVLMNDVTRSLEAPTPAEAFLRMMLGRPVEYEAYPVNFIYPEEADNSSPISQSDYQDLNIEEVHNAVGSTPQTRRAVPSRYSRADAERLRERISSLRAAQAATSQRDLISPDFQNRTNTALSRAEDLLRRIDSEFTQQ